MKKVIIVISVMSFLFVTIFAAFNQSSNDFPFLKTPITSTATEEKNKELKERAAEKGAQAEIDALERSIYQQIDEIDQFLADEASKDSSAYIETAAEAAEFEALISEVEELIGEEEGFTPVSTELGPNAKEEYRKLDEKFDELDQEMQKIINKL